METIQTRIKNAYEAMKGDFGYKNVMQAPKIEKIVLSVGTGRVQDKARIALIQDRLARITGQKASPRPAKKSIASFKLREGDVIGYQVTLRGARMRHFLDKLINIAIPQTRDFHGLKVTAIDDMGNYTIGIKDHTIFPECSDEELKDVFSLAITLVTTTKDKKETEAFLRQIGLPLKKEEEGK
ncbi:MAG: 50S ribosomal protein L5 [Candidatus Nomurabacteria bacterium]|nr:50S ribosomal protein L5 [Candidatus Nomurabacteria bacterium]USN87483.1 MAG: 50S ribosomal protein L5 [Candidatus Nomurabacteria bacterium]